MVFTRASLDAIVAAGRKPRPVTIPGVGDIHVRALSGAERERIENRARPGDATDTRARVALVAVCDESGGPVFAADDLPALNSLPWRALEAIVEASDDYAPAPVPVPTEADAEPAKPRTVAATARRLGPDPSKTTATRVGPDPSKSTGVRVDPAPEPEPAPAAG